MALRLIKSPFSVIMHPTLPGQLQPRIKWAVHKYNGFPTVDLTVAAQYRF